MSTVSVSPGSLHGRVRAPPSKSYTHRAIVAAHLATRPGTVDGPLVADDTLRTLRAIRALGSTTRRTAHRWTIRPGTAGRPRLRTIDCGESGTTLRFACALAALQSSPFQLVGSGRLPHRPIGPLVDALRQLGATVEPPRHGQSLPLRVRGPIHGGEVSLDSSVSSQFTSALLLSLPVAPRASTIRLVGRPVSEPYVQATLALLRARGLRFVESPRGFRIAGAQAYPAVRWKVPGDASSAAYLWAGAAISHGSVEVEGVDTQWPQADLAILELLLRFGASVRHQRDRIRVEGGTRRPFRFDLDGCPDLLPLAGVLAAAAPGRSVLVGAAHASTKESDRRAETMKLVQAMGAKAVLSPHKLIVDGRSDPRPVRLRASHDHRVVMSAAVAALAASRPSSLADADCTGKSFPEFFEVWSRLGAEVKAP